MTTLGIVSANNARNAQTTKRNEALEKAKNNYNRKTDAATAQNDKASDNNRQALHKAGSKAAKKINSAFTSAKVNTSRGGDYGKMSSADVATDMAKRAAGKAWNGAVETGRTVAKGGYIAAKTLAKGATYVEAVREKAVNHAAGGAKKAWNAAKTLAKQAANRASTVATNIKSTAGAVGTVIKSFFG